MDFVFVLCFVDLYDFVWVLRFCTFVMCVLRGCRFCVIIAAYALGYVLLFWCECSSGYLLCVVSLCLVLLLVGFESSRFGRCWICCF